MAAKNSLTEVDYIDITGVDSNMKKSHALIMKCDDDHDRLAHSCYFGYYLNDGQCDLWYAHYGYLLRAYVDSYLLAC